jgi:hypothetical protein
VSRATLVMREIIEIVRIFPRNVFDCSPKHKLDLSLILRESQKLPDKFLIMKKFLDFSTRFYFRQPFFLPLVRGRN